MANLGNGVIYPLYANSYVTQPNTISTVNGVIYPLYANSYVTQPNTISTGIISDIVPLYNLTASNSQIFLSYPTTLYGNTYINSTNNGTINLSYPTTLYGNTYINSTNNYTNMITQEVNNTFGSPNFIFRKL
jgi:hypothetical protein